MITDNLSSLFAPAPRGAAMAATFRMARLLAFDADDGSNEVLITGSPDPLEDLQLLVTGAQIGLEAGDNVLLMYLGNSVMIIGKVASVGGSNYGPANDGVAGLQLANSGFAAANAGTVVISDSTIVVPGWAHSAAVTMLGSAGLRNTEVTGSNDDDLTSQVKMTCTGQADVTSNSHHNDVKAGDYGATNAYFSSIVPVTPLATLTFSYLVGPGANWSADAGNGATLSVSVQFFRESA